ncbi:hypothetical protein L596_029086 [Steinernema carpocapsae]|uniref:Uncharacterized protein n=2 Tax=Steinernema carpocapsae TaxID=34508 RepID=A0A4U5LTL2_STECR|nr:hypothetical protein L596_029086 [Steinernema carpocapsae]
MPIQEPENAPAVEAEVQPILEVSNVSMTITEQPEEATNGTETDRITEVLMGQNEAVESKPETPLESLDKIVSEGSENKNETGVEVLDKEASEGSLDNAILSHNNTRSVEEVEEILLKNENEVKEENFGPNAACDTDVMFLIDRSQSVDSDFAKDAQIVSQERKEELNILPSTQGDAKSKEQPKVDQAKTQSEETKHSEDPKTEEPK